MKNYYYLAGSLPALKITEKPDISFEDLVFRLETNLEKGHLEQVRRIRKYIDVCNIRNFLWEIPIDNRGNLDFNELEQEVFLKGWFDDYVFDYLDAYPDELDQLANFSRLLIQFFQYEIEHSKGFLRKYFTFEREWRLLLTAFRSKELNKDLSLELQFEEPTDPLVAYILAQKDAASFSTPVEYEDLKEIYHLYKDKPQEMQRQLTIYRIEKIDEMVEGTVFSIEAVLAYVVKLIIVEDFIALDVKVGRQHLEKIKEG